MIKLKYLLSEAEILTRDRPNATYWKMIPRRIPKGSNIQYGAKNTVGTSRYFPDEETAKRYAQSAEQKRIVQISSRPIQYKTVYKNRFHK